MENHLKSQNFDRAPYLYMRPTTGQLQNIVPSHPDQPSNALKVDTVHRGRFLEGGVNHGGFGVCQLFLGVNIDVF